MAVFGVPLTSNDFWEPSVKGADKFIAYYEPLLRAVKSSRPCQNLEVISSDSLTILTISGSGYSHCKANQSEVLDI